MNPVVMVDRLMSAIGAGLGRLEDLLEAQQVFRVQSDAIPVAQFEAPDPAEVSGSTLPQRQQRIRWTHVMTEKLHEMQAIGLKPAAIARELGISLSKVRDKIKQEKRNSRFRNRVDSNS